MKRLAGLLLAGAALWGQPYDLLIRGGHVIDPANGIDGVLDVAVTGTKIARVAPALEAAQARKVIDARGLYVTPGLVDIHAHVFGYSGSLLADDTALLTGATTIVDAGGAGWRTFDEFRRSVIERSRTRVLALINIVGWGMLGPKYEDNVEDMDPVKTAEAIRRHRDVIVGIKTAHFSGTGWTAIRRAIEAGKLAGVPVMIDDKIFTNTGRTSREKLLEIMRPGDIHTHVYNDRQVEILDRFTGKVQPYAVEARKRGVIFDLGHGAGSFLWPVAARAMAQGFYPDTISTDLHADSILATESDMANSISKMMLLGMSLREAIERSTVRPAQVIGRYPELGTLSEGREADIALFELRRGVFAYKDAWKKKMLGKERLECVMSLRAGRIAFDAKGLAFPDWRTAGGDEVLP
jgi:dihydroorotase